MRKRRSRVLLSSLTGTVSFLSLHDGPLVGLSKPNMSSKTGEDRNSTALWTAKLTLSLERMMISASGRLKGDSAGLGRGLGGCAVVSPGTSTDCIR